MTLQEKLDFALKRFTECYGGRYTLSFSTDYVRHYVLVRVMKIESGEVKEVKIPLNKMYKVNVITFYHQLSDWVYVKFNK